MWQVQAVARPRRIRALIMALALVPALIFALSACGGNSVGRLPIVSYSRRSRPYWQLRVISLTVVTKTRPRCCPLSGFIRHNFFACT